MYLPLSPHVVAFVVPDFVLYINLLSDVIFLTHIRLQLFAFVLKKFPEAPRSLMFGNNNNNNN